MVVTGGAGFIGANLCRELAARPCVTEVVAYDDLSSGSPANLTWGAHGGAAVRLVLGSVLNRRRLGETLDGADAVVHLAARSSVPGSLQDPVTGHNVNVTGTVHLLEECRRRRLHVVAASSSSVYGSAAGRHKDEDVAPRPISPYAAGKLATEAYVLAYGACFGLPTLALRFFNVYGPLQPAGVAAAVVPSFVAAALRGEPLCVHGDGGQTRDFTYVGTVVRVLADAVIRRVTCPSPVNLAFGGRVSLLELAHLVADVTGVPVEIRHTPARRCDGPGATSTGALLRRLFPGVVPTPLRDGLERTVAWFRETLNREAGHPELSSPNTLSTPSTPSARSAPSPDPTLI